MKHALLYTGRLLGSLAVIAGFCGFILTGNVDGLLLCAAGLLGALLCSDGKII